MKLTSPRTQADQMAAIFPDLYRPVSAEQAAIAARPIAGMLFEIDQEIRHRVTGDRGTIESCTYHPESDRLEYVVTWSNGRRGWAFESQLEAV